MTQQEPAVNSLPTLLIRVPPRNGETDHWGTQSSQSSASNLLRQSGARGFRWHHGSGSDQHFSGKFTDQQLTWLGLYGCEVELNITKFTQEAATRKIKESLDQVKFSTAELQEVDVEQLFAEHVAELVRSQKIAHRIR